MSYRNLVCMNIAVIGDGRVAESVARDLAIAEHNIIIGIKDEFSSIDARLFDEFDNIMLSSIEHAASLADMIIIATPAAEVREAAYMLDDVRTKVIIDMSAFENTTAEMPFLTHKAIAAITFSPHVVKCFSKDYYHNAFNPFKLATAKEMYAAGDSRKAKEMVRLISRDMRIAKFFDIGDNENITILDEMAFSESLNLIAEPEKVEVPVRR